MGFVELVERAPDPADPAFHLDLPATAEIQQLVGTSDRIKVGDFIGSYRVVRTGGGNHNDTPARTITLALGDREVGRLILIPTEGREGFLEFVRVFPDKAEYDRFLEELDRGLPPGVRRIPARALSEGDLIVDAAGRPMSKVDTFELFVARNRVLVSITTKDRDGRIFPAQTFEPQEELNIRAS